MSRSFSGPSAATGTDRFAPRAPAARGPKLCLNSFDGIGNRRMMTPFHPFVPPVE
jgi:hypothetical protein